MPGLGGDQPAQHRHAAADQLGTDRQRHLHRRGVRERHRSVPTSRPNVGGTEDWQPAPDDGGVWFEGTGQLALALRKRDRSGDLAASDALLATLRTAQAELGADQTFGGKRIEGGIQAATSPIDTGFGFAYHPHLHTAATSWYVMAATGFNPYRFS